MAPAKYHYGQFPPSDRIEWSKLIPLIGPANAAVARYDGILTAIPNPKVLLSPLTTQEAVLSSKIEGTQATMGEVLEYEAQESNKKTVSKKDADILEVLNYRISMTRATEMLKELPVCQRIILECHKILLNSVRGHGKSPGEYRKIPNWIGRKGCSIDEATFIPIDADKLPESLSRWEKFVNEDFPDKLVQLALLHAEFEALHPFLDGNGRLGRMLVPLYLFKCGLIKQPMFYISAYLEQHRDEYYDRLLAVSDSGNWTGWCMFFLEAIRTQAEENMDKAGKILGLYNNMKSQVSEITHSQYAIHALDWIFEKPIFKSTDFTKSAGIPAPTAKRIIKVLENENIINKCHEASGRRAATFAFPTLLNIAEGRDIF